jgi:proline dehydrogenase
MRSRSETSRPARTPAPGEPGDAVAWRCASRYVAGRSREDALVTAGRLLEQGHGISLDLFGERVNDAVVADRALADYLKLAAALPPPPADAWLSVDLSHLALRVDARAAADRLRQIAAALPSGRRVQVGAEETATADAVMTCLGADRYRLPAAGAPLGPARHAIFTCHS